MSHPPRRQGLIIEGDQKNIRGGGELVEIGSRDCSTGEQYRDPQQKDRGDREAEGGLPPSRHEPVDKQEARCNLYRGSESKQKSGPSLMSTTCQ